MTSRGDNIIRLQRAAGGVATNIRQSLYAGRNEVVTNGPNPEFAFIGSDPYDTNAYTGLVVPATPTSQVGGRYLFLLARQSFSTGEQSSDRRGVRLVGIRQYAELIARIPSRVSPLATNSGPPVGGTVIFRKEIDSPLWHPPDGDISWHVMIINKVQRDTRNPSNADGFMYQDSLSPALLYQTAAPYTPPNGGRPWGTPIGASLGNIHELRYRWRSDYSEYALDIPIPVPCDVVLFASVRQNDPTLNPTLADPTSSAFSALSSEDQFLTAFNNYVQYGSIAGALVFDQNLGEDVP
jgi:hypothetical protein